MGVGGAPGHSFRKRRSVVCLYRCSRGLHVGCPTELLVVLHLLCIPPSPSVYPSPLPLCPPPTPTPHPSPSDGMLWMSGNSGLPFCHLILLSHLQSCCFLTGRLPLSVSRHLSVNRPSPFSSFFYFYVFFFNFFFSPEDPQTFFVKSSALWCGAC